MSFSKFMFQFTVDCSHCRFTAGNCPIPEVLQCFPQTRFIALGGATEASIWSNFHEFREDSPDLPLVPYGKALENQSIYVLDRHMRVCPPHVVGEIYIGGQGLAKEYLNDKEKTANSLLRVDLSAPNKQVSFRFLDVFSLFGRFGATAWRVDRFEPGFRTIVPWGDSTARGTRASTFRTERSGFWAGRTTK